MGKKLGTYKSMKEPIYYYEKINEMKQMMEDNIHDLVYRYGEKIGTEGYEYKFKDDCIIVNPDDERDKVESIFIKNPDKLQGRGHMMFKLKSGIRCSFATLDNQEFNIYSPLHYEISKIVAK